LSSGQELLGLVTEPARRLSAAILIDAMVIRRDVLPAVLVLLGERA